MKKRFGWFLAIIVALIMTVVPLGQTQHAQAADNSLEQIQKKGVLVMGTSPDYPPYEFKQRSTVRVQWDGCSDWETSC